MSYMKLKKIKEIYPDLLLIMIVGLLSITWFRGDFIVNPGDTNFSFNPPNDLLRSFFVWDHQQGFGRVDSMATAKIFPYNLLLSLLSLFGISIYGSQKILFYLIFTTSGVTAYFLIKYLLTSKSYNRIVALLGANFYMMNTYLIQLRWGSGYLMSLFFYVIFPLIVLMWFKGRTTKDIKYGIYMALSCLLALPSLSNPAHFLSILVICGLDLLLQLFTNFRNKLNLISLFKYVFTTFLIFVFILAFWMASIAITFKDSLINLSKTTLQFRQEIVTASMSSILNLFRNLGDWGFWTAHAGDLYYPYSPLYRTPLFIIIGFAIVLFSFTALFFLKTQDTEQKHNSIFFSLVFLIGIWLSKGIHDYWRNIYQWAVHNIPLAGALRAAYEKSGILMVIGTTVLVAFSLAIVLQCAKTRNRRIALILFLFSLINIYAWPFWTGDIWRNQSKILPGFRFQIPEYYSDIKKYLDNPEQQGYRILQFPDNATPVPGIITLNLNGRLYSGSDPLSRILETPSIYLNSFNFSVSENMTSMLFQNYSTNPHAFFGGIRSLSKILNIKSVLLRNDSDNTLYSNIRDPDKIRYFLSSFIIEKSFGKLDLYKIADNYFLPHFYPSITPTAIAGDIEVLVPMSYTRYLDRKPVLLFMGQRTEDGEQKTENYFKDINNFVFKDGAWQDLAIKLAAHGSWLMADGKNEEKKFKMEKSGVYEIYVDVSKVEGREQIVENRNWQIKIDGLKLEYSSIWGSEYLGRKEKGQKYVKIGEMELDEGRHTIQVTNPKLKVTSEEDFKNLKLVLVHRDEKEKVEDIVWQKINQPGTEVCYIFEGEKGEFYIP